MRFRPVVVVLVLSLMPVSAQAFKGPKSELIDPRWLQHEAQSTAVVDHGPWAEFLKTYLLEGADGVNRLRYGAVTPADKAALDNYVVRLETTPVSTLNRNEQMAYWFNLYNAVTVKIVIEAYPVKSIRKVLSGGFFSPGPWKRDLVTVEGQRLSLDDIEHGIMRPIWQDNRIHYGVNCASIGCPNLAPVPFTADRLEAMLDKAARDYVNHPRAATFDDRGRLTASQIYDWYDPDFGGSERGIIAHLKRYAGPELTARLGTVEDIRDYEYDWSLNDAD
ncbi:MAG: DUF547 domain-containing protein [Alphaproteobacteria bacterium]